MFPTLAVPWLCALPPQRPARTGAVATCSLAGAGQLLQFAGLLRGVPFSSHVSILA